MIGSMMPGRNAHIFAHGGKYCIFCDATKPGYDCPRTPPVETLMYQAIAASTNRPCGSRPCDEEFPAMLWHWCHGCLIAALCRRIGWEALSPVAGRESIADEGREALPAPETMSEPSSPLRHGD